MIKKALLIEGARADEVVEKPPVIFKVERHAFVLPAGIDRGQLHPKLADLRVGPEGIGRSDRRAVREPHDRVFRIVAVGGLDRLREGVDAAAAKPQGWLIVALHVGIAQAVVPPGLPGEDAGPSHRGTVAVDTRERAVDRVPDTTSPGNFLLEKVS